MVQNLVTWIIIEKGWSELSSFIVKVREEMPNCDLYNDPMFY